MKKFIKKALCVLLSAAMVLPLASCSEGGSKASLTQETESIFTDPSKISYSREYTELKADKTNKTKSWRQGMVSGNGLCGFVTSGAPYEDTYIFQNMHFILPNENARTCPQTFDELETVKQSIVSGKDIVDDASYDDVYGYHPGGELRISSQKGKAKDYLRYTDYETAETGVKYSDKNGTVTRTAFTSFADGVSIIKIDAGGAKLDLTVSFDDISALANFGSGNETDLKYKKLAESGGNWLALAAHYPDYENSELKRGGYTTAVYIVSDGGTKEKVNEEKSFSESQFSGDNSAVKITDAGSVYLIAVSERTYDMGEYSDFEAQNNFDVVDSAVKKLEAVAEKYKSDAGFDYDTALQNHLKIYSPQFDAVTLSLGENDYSANEDLLTAQKGKKSLNSALAQRAYYAGRCAYLCCSGYSTSRLYGMWTGEWNTGWGSKYTMDANVNLQTSSLNTGNIQSAPIGYTYFLLRQMPDWEENAYATHGFADAIQAPVNTDGDKAVITETCYPYPFRYWNAGASWMLQPLYETLLCYGDIDIPLCDEINLNKLRSVLSPTEADLTDSQISSLEERGYLKLEEDVLYPLLIKSANYWQQLLTAEYYTAADGSIHYERGKTELAADESYCILPSYSPENNPKNYPSPSDANCTIDIAACRDNLNMLIAVSNDVSPQGSTEKWQNLKDKLPPYIYDDTGALKEWATTTFEENNEHRHLSHLYVAWPLFETQNDSGLKKASLQAIANRTSENEASHALVHRSLIAARLKDSESLTQALLKLSNHKIRYDSLMTNHDYDRGSCYCTDFAIGYLGIINEALVYSDEASIEFLPALPESGFESGKITGVKARCRATVTSLEWNEGSVSAVITSDREQTLKITCGGEMQEIYFAAGESKTVDFLR